MLLFRAFDCLMFKGTFKALFVPLKGVKRYKKRDDLATISF